MTDLAGIYPQIRPQVSSIEVGSPADRGGLRPNDQIVAVNGRPVLDGDDFVAAIQKLPGRPTAISIERDGKALVLSVTPRNEGGVGKIGVGLGSFRRYPPLRALRESVKHNVRIVTTTVVFLEKVLRGELSAKRTLSGPVGIFQETARAAKRGFSYLLYMVGFLSISIAFVNLLPIPLLDGGQIVILLVESVIRRDLSLKVKEYVGYVGLAVIVALMAMVLYFDVSKL
jgi:regulator of sigma E protease